MKERWHTYLSTNWEAAGYKGLKSHDWLLPNQQELGQLLRSLQKIALLLCLPALFHLDDININVESEERTKYSEQVRDVLAAVIVVAVLQ